MYENNSSKYDEVLKVFSFRPKNNNFKDVKNDKIVADNSTFNTGKSCWIVAGDKILWRYEIFVGNEMVAVYAATLIEALYYAKSRGVFFGKEDHIIKVVSCVTATFHIDFNVHVVPTIFNGKSEIYFNIINQVSVEEK
jgi:hypothetical protein